MEETQEIRDKWIQTYKNLGWKMAPVRNKKRITRDDEVEKAENLIHDLKYDIAILTGKHSGIAIVDCDRIDHPQVLAEQTQSVKTNHGTHYVFRIPAGVEISNKQDIYNTNPEHKKDLPQIDIRGNGGYFVAAPAKGYEWQDGEIKEFPKWLLNYLNYKRQTATARKYVSNVPQEGEKRHPWFQAEITSVLAHGWTLEKIQNHFCTLNKGLDEPLEETDLLAYIDRLHRMHITNQARKAEDDKEQDWLQTAESNLLDSSPLGEPEFRTSFTVLDKSIWGFNRGKLTVIAGNPSSGKSLVTQLSMLENIKLSKKCLLFSAEMTREDTITRWAIHEYGVDSDHFLNKQYTDEEKESISNMISWLSTKDFRIYDGLIGIKQIEKMTEEYKPDIVYIDYFQDCMFEKEGFQIREEFVHRLHVMAKFYQIPIILATQVNEKWIKKNDQEPPYEGHYEKVRINCSDVRTTQALYHKADLILLLTNYDSKVNEQHIVMVDVGKNKINGKKPCYYYELDRSTLSYRILTRSAFMAIKEECK